jgi:hypothetical protein
MTQSTQRAAGSTAPSERGWAGRAYPETEHHHKRAHTGVLSVVPTILGRGLNVIGHPDSTLQSWYNHEFPGVFRNGIEEMHRRSICSGNDGDPFGAEMRSIS